MIQNAKIHFNELGTPVADAFDDVYFSNDDGLKESHYVFFIQNRIDERLQNHDREHFVIAETGFGTGLNFLNAWQQFDALRDTRKVKRLHFVSFEKFPINQADLEKALSAWPTVAHYAKQLCSQYPMALKGCHRLVFDNGNVVLDLWFGDVQESLPQMSYSDRGIVDAWFLDGFAPSKNPEMWQQSLFDEMANLSRKGATVATFTAAGFVRRGLIDAGFNMVKSKGYGRKREMLTGELNNVTDAKHEKVYFTHAPRTLDRVAIIGGGIASASLSFALAKRGRSVSVFCADNEFAMGASHNRQGAVYPHLQADFTVQSEMYAHSFLYAKRLYQQLLNEGFDYAHQWCGVLIQAISQTVADRQTNIMDKATWPDALLRKLDEQEADQIAGLPTGHSGLFIEQAGWVSPPELTQAVSAKAASLKSMDTRFNCKILDIEPTDSGWLLHTGSETFGPFSDVFVSAGEHSDGFTQTSALPLHGVRGQVSHIQASNNSMKLSTVLCHKGYFTPAHQGEHCMGATFDKNTKSRAVTDEDNQINQAQLARFYGDQPWYQTLGEITGAKSAVRCCFSDHLPMLGEVIDESRYDHAFGNLRKGKHYDFAQLERPHEGLHVFTGFGARGLCSAPLLAEHYVSCLLDEPRPLSERLNEGLHPARFVIRGLLRKER
ncbi:bifunctional tRNA (5-methylaminomethyl-2-thiouridine)(34)-methyltransferase MnmC2/FAD-dependent 5-carboxymethylaminomethyl-2-thiouridine(34) oxidoreductase MnmC1 [Pseudoalteromonas xiamenensis]